MSIYKQIIFLSLLLVAVMALCVVVHIGDFEEVEEKKVENIIDQKVQIEVENKTIIEDTKEEENTEKIIEEKKELITPVISKVEEKKPASNIKKTPSVERIEELSKKIQPKQNEVEAFDAQKELDKIVSKQKIFFKRLGTDVTKKSYVVIKDIAKFLKDNPTVKIEIGGHTDAKGKDDVNKWVSLQRALSVKKDLIKLGINKKRIKAKGYGETKPLVPNDKNGYSTENRRVEFKVVED